MSSEWIDIFHPATGECLQIPNTLRAIRAFVRRMQPDETLVFEATSSCDDRILRIVREEHTPFVRVNPAHAWHFARACNLPKTDKVDARMLSAFAAARNFAPQEPSSTARDRVAALVKRRRQLKDMEVQEKTA
ncbi:MAG: IS110 family transposase [Rhodomicrobium sp.]|nr:IS110 family transposase [Rhodomicrobium sp.]